MMNTPVHDNRKSGSEEKKRLPCDFQLTYHLSMPLLSACSTEGGTEFYSNQIELTALISAYSL